MGKKKYKYVIPSIVKGYRVWKLMINFRKILNRRCVAWVK